MADVLSYTLPLGLAWQQREQEKSAHRLTLAFITSRNITKESFPLNSSIFKRELYRPNVRESPFQNLGNFNLWNPECGKIFLMESGILGFGTCNTAQGIWNPTNDWNPESKF